MFFKICRVLCVLVLFCAWGFCSETRPEFSDLSVTWVHREPQTPSWNGLVKMEDGTPVLNPSAPRPKNRWPAPGSQVAFIAHIENQGNASSNQAFCLWRVDGQAIKREDIPSLNSYESFESRIDWKWLIGIHNITVELNYPTSDTRELTNANHAITIRSDALPFCFYVNNKVRKIFQEQRNLLGSHSVADWIQAHVAQFNKSLRESKYPSALEGCMEQIYVDRLAYYDSLKDLPGIQLRFDPEAQGTMTFEPFKGMAEWAKDLDPQLFLQLCYCLGMVDLSSLDVEPSRNLVPGPGGYPLYWRYSPEPLMTQKQSREYRFSEFCVLAFNRQYARPRGYYGDFFYDLPDENILYFMDRSDKALPKARVRIFQRNLEGQIAPEPVIEAETDAKGGLKLPNRPAPNVATERGFTQHPNPFGKIDISGKNGLFLIEIRAREQTDYLWMDITRLNIGYWRAVINSRWSDYPIYSITHDVHTRIATQGAPSSPVHFRSDRIRPDALGFEWLPSMNQGVEKYRLYAMQDQPESQGGIFEPVSEIPFPGTTVDNIPVPSVDTWFAMTAVDSQGRDGPFSDWLYLPLISRLKSLAFAPENLYYLYDEGTKRLLCLHEDGRYIPFYFYPPDQNINVASIAWSPLNELAICNLEQDRVEFYSLNGKYLRSVGKSGKLPGQFLDPTDVAFNQKKEMAVADRGNRRIQIFDAQGKFLDRFGEVMIDDPVAVAFAPDGNLHVIDAAKKSCLVFIEGVKHKFYYEYSYGSFLSPADIISTTDGTMYISDPENRGIFVYSSAGRLIRIEHPVPQQGFDFTTPRGLTQDSKGRIAYIDRASFRIRFLP